MLYATSNKNAQLGRQNEALVMSGKRQPSPRELRFG